jgi:hypothetical protein
VTEAKILGLLRERYSDREWAFFSHLRSGTGAGNARTFDAFAINTWPSKGYLRLAFEVKVSRQDLVHEFMSPWKRADAMENSNQFFFVAPKGLVKAMELPDGCGLLELDAGGLKNTVLAKHREIKPPEMNFICSLFRKSSLEAPALKLFKYAGKEMTDEDLVALIEEKKDWGAQQEIAREVNKRVEVWKANQLESRLSDAVQKAMEGYSPPTAETFNTWFKGLKNGVPLEKLKHLKYGADQLSRDLNRILEPFNDRDKNKPQAAPHDEPARTPDAPGPKAPDAPPDPPAAEQPF